MLGRIGLENKKTKVGIEWHPIAALDLFPTTKLRALDTKVIEAFIVLDLECCSLDDHRTW